MLNTREALPAEEKPDYSDFGESDCTYIYLTEPEDNKATEEVKEPDLNVLTLARHGDIDVLEQVLKYFDQDKISLEVLREKFSTQSRDEEYQGTNAAWWLSHAATKESLSLLYKFIKRGIITPEQLAQSCDGSLYRGTNSLVWIVGEKLKNNSYSPLYHLALLGFINSDQLLGTTTEDQLTLNVLDMLVSKIVDHPGERNIENILGLLLEKQHPKVITSAVISNRMAEILSDDNLEKNKSLNDTTQRLILAFHMICKASGRQLFSDSLNSKAIAIINDFDQQVVNLLIGILPSSIRASADDLRDDKDFENLLIYKILSFKNKPAYFIIEPQSPLLPQWATQLFNLNFFKHYIQNYLVPIAKKNLLEEGKMIFIDNTAKLLKKFILERPGGWRIVTSDLISNFKEVMKMGLDRYFSENPFAVISRNKQIKISSQIIAVAIKETTSQQAIFNPEVVFEIVKKIVSSENLTPSLLAKSGLYAESASVTNRQSVSIKTPMP